MKNKFAEILKNYEETGCDGFIDRSLCYHPDDGCRGRGDNGKCHILTDTVFRVGNVGFKTCPFYKTEEQFATECKEHRTHYVSI